MLHRHETGTQNSETGHGRHHRPSPPGPPENWNSESASQSIHLEHFQVEYQVTPHTTSFQTRIDGRQHIDMSASITPRLVSRATFASSSRSIHSSSSTRCFSAIHTYAFASPAIRNPPFPSNSLAVTKQISRPARRLFSANPHLKSVVGGQSAKRWNSSLAQQPSSSSNDTSAPPPTPLPSSSPKIRVTPPSLQAIKDEGFSDDNVELVPEQEARLIITPEAVQVR
jgi:hypothetical protein